MVVGFNGLVSSIQTLVGANRRPRIDESEIAELRRVYGDSIDYSQIRVKEGNLGLANGLAPHTIGNTIYIPEGWLNPNSQIIKPTETNCSRTKPRTSGNIKTAERITSANRSGISSKAGFPAEAATPHTITAKPLTRGKSWADLNPEQQADLMEESYRDGLFNNPNARLVYNGTDYTDFARTAIAEMRAGHGAP